jgi:adenosylcobinamide kinase/adenosylcobinamide-phosphate guanylyltransferase
MRPRESHLVLGGARSGKSRHAVAQARSAGGRIAFVGTARPGDPDMRRRIARHQAERPRDWITVDEPCEVVAACRDLARRAEVIIVDCLTVWVANLLERDTDDGVALTAAGGLAALIGERLATIIAVSNEVGSGVHPLTAIGLRFQDALGGVNQAIAAAADRVTLMVSGIPVEIKRPVEPTPPRAAARPRAERGTPPPASHEHPPQAP